MAVVKKEDMQGFLIEIQDNINFYINYFNDKSKYPSWSSIENEQNFAINMINKQLNHIKDGWGEDEVYKQIEKLKINYRMKL